MRKVLLTFSIVVSDDDMSTDTLNFWLNEAIAVGTVAIDESISLSMDVVDTWYETGSNPDEEVGV